MDPALTAGHTYVAGVECFTSNPYKFAMLTKKDNKLFAFNAILNSYTSLASFNQVAELEVADINKMIQPVYHGGMDFWYIAIGRKIYRTSVTGLELQLVLTLPNDASGDIVSFNFNFNEANNFTTIGITTYNPASSKALKGSFYMYNIAEDAFTEAHLNVIHKAKGLRIGF